MKLLLESIRLIHNENNNHFITRIKQTQRIRVDRFHLQRTSLCGNIANANFRPGQNSRARIFVKTDRSCDRDTTMLAFKLKLGAKNNANRMRGMVGGMVQNSTNQNHYQHQQPICSSKVFFYINNKIRPTSTINITVNIRNMPNSTTKENQNQQKFLFSSTTICLTSNIAHRLQQQNTFNNLGTNDWLWSREVGTQKF